jgi:MoaA/NifB/PqqE/SkfB family radical SAM enzyme
LERHGSDRRGYFRVAARLLYNAWRFRRARRRGEPLKPAVLSLAVTNRCNSHCIMCNIWKSAGEIPDIESLELSRDDIIGLLSTPLFSELVELDLTGGEPHLRDDLVDIVLEIIRLKQSYLPRLRSIIITSNGYLTPRIISSYKAILDSLRGTDIDLVSVTSLDGIGDTHDRIRGTRGAFKMASGTIDGFLELKEKYPNFIAGIKTTILPHNVNALDDILDFALSRNLFHVISPVLFAGARFRNIDLREDLALGPSELKKVMDFYGRNELETSYFYSTARRFLAAGRKPWACTALYNYAFINYEGNVYPCEIIPEPIGNVKEHAFEDIWRSPGAYDWREKIGRMDCCRTCHEPGAVRYSAFTGGWSYLRFLINSGGCGYRESWLGEGFSKY